MKRGFNEGVYKGTKGINRFTTDYIDWCWNHIIVTGVMVMLISKVWWTAILNNKLIFLESFEKAISYVGLNPDDLDRKMPIVNFVLFLHPIYLVQRKVK